MYSNTLICDVLDYINRNINKEITIDELSNLFYFDKTYIMKRFKREIGVSIHDYINRVRILNSLPLYRYDNYILSIALSNGFNSAPSKVLVNGVEKSSCNDNKYCD